MTLHTILVPVRGDGLGEGVLNHALALGRRFDAHLDIVHCRPNPEDLLPFGVFVPAALKQEITASAGSLANEEEQRVKTLFEDYCRRHQLTVVTARPWPRDRMSVSWREETGKQAAIVGVLGRLADVVVVAQPDHSRNLGLNTLEAALLESGRPVLLCPPKPLAGPLGAHVAVAWNGSTEAARAIAATLPVLAAADKVTLLAVSTGTKEALAPAAVRDYLSDHGIVAEVRSQTARGSEVGQALLLATREAGADLLLMGAYGQSRRRELIMGGVTQHVIDESDLPVLLCH
ncbi:MAG: universal stress protein [Kiloniellales bacterium]|nr:universal stress protein [Kiloniellales bacterium]